MEKTRRCTRIIPVLFALPLGLASVAHADPAPTAGQSDSATTAPAEEAEKAVAPEPVVLAQADTTADEGAASEETAATVSEEAAAPVEQTAAQKQEETRKDAVKTTNPALAPGGIVSSGSSFPLHMNISMTQSVGAGTFSPGATFTPSLPTNLSLRPFYNVHKFVDWQPRMILNGRMDLDIDWASNSYGTLGASTADRMLRVSDPNVGLVLPGLLSSSFGTDFLSGSMSPVVRAIFPLSVASRFQNRLMGFGAALQNMMNVSAGDFGTFTFIYSPSVSSWSFTGDSSSVKCGETLNPGGGLFGAANPADGQTEVPLAVARPEEYTDDSGQCRVRGRQVVGSAVNSFVTAYSISDPWGGNHQAAISAGAWHLFLRPLNDRPDLRSENATSQSFLGFSEFSFGDISYSYSLPIETNVTITAGVSSLQTMFDNHGNPRLPWFDLVILNPSTFGRGANNATSGYLNLTLAI